MVDNSLFGKRLKAARTRKAHRLGYKTARGYPQEQLGIDAEIDEESASARINQYEKGRRLPDIGTAGKLAEVLEVPLAYLFCKEDDLAELLLAAFELSSSKRKELAQQAREARTQ